MLIGLNRLEKIMAESPDGKSEKICEKCIDCGLPIQIEIHKTSGGYGLAGGVLYDANGFLCAKCPDCYNKYAKLKQTDQLKSIFACGLAFCFSFIDWCSEAISKKYCHSGDGQ